MPLISYTLYEYATEEYGLLSMLDVFEFPTSHYNYDP